MPEHLPSVAKIAHYRIIPVRTVGAFEPLVGDTRFAGFNAGRSDKWAGTYTFVPMRSDDLRVLSAWLQRLGRINTFYAFDPGRRIPQKGVLQGLRVDGGSSTGYEIAVKDGPVSETPLVAGDYVQIGDQYYELTEDLTTDSSGKGTLKVWPAVRSSPPNNAPVVTENPVMIARVTSPVPRESGPDRITQITISWTEV